MINRKLHIILFRLASSLSSSMTLNKVDRRWVWTTSNCSEFHVISQIWEATTAKRMKTGHIVCSGLYRLDYVDICWAFLRCRFAIRIQWVKTVKWRFLTYIREKHFTNDK